MKTEQPTVPHVRLGTGEIYCGTAAGIPTVARDIPERTPEEIAGDVDWAWAIAIAMSDYRKRR